MTDTPALRSDSFRSRTQSEGDAMATNEFTGLMTELLYHQLLSVLPTLCRQGWMTRAGYFGFLSRYG